MIVFRTDANEYIASGHLMRCIAIAEEYIDRGGSCLFLLAEDKMTHLLKKKNIPYQVLHTQWNHMENECGLLCRMMKDLSPDWLIVDSYQATKQYLETLQCYVQVLYIDDTMEEHYSLSGLLHYGIGSEEYANDYPARKGILCGIQYTPLRREFRVHSDVPENDMENIPGSMLLENREEKIFLSTGGTDPYGITGDVLHRCSVCSEFREYQFEVIVGAMNVEEEKLRQMAEEEPRIRLHKNVSNMGDLMRGCQMAVSAAGTTLLELCACGTPTVCFSFADNQKIGAEDMERLGIMVSAGDARENPAIAETIVQKLLYYAKHPAERVRCQERMMQLLDGKGTMRIVDFLQKHGEHRKESCLDKEKCR
jgi:UDP-2,4-diacetamido-2,4,6-trideoxy-beta-L-altropyranose hydrolase